MFQQIDLAIQIEDVEYRVLKDRSGTDFRAGKSPWAAPIWRLEMMCNSSET